MLDQPEGSPCLNYFLFFRSSELHHTILVPIAGPRHPLRPAVGTARVPENTHYYHTMVVATVDVTARGVRMALGLCESPS